MALPLWVGLFAFFLGVILPWQTGAYLHQHLPSTLNRLADSIHAQAELHDVDIGLWRSSAVLRLRADWMREPLELRLHMRHGPWLGLHKNQPALGWFALHATLPSQGGISLFPAHQDVNAWLLADMWGDFQLGANRANANESLGRILLHAPTRRHGAHCLGELRLPGFKWLTPAGDLIVADVALRADLHRNQGRRQGELSMDAVSAAWVIAPVVRSAGSPAALPPSLLLDLPRIDLDFDQQTRLQAAWANGRGVNLAPLGLGNSMELGRMHASLGWRDIDWDAVLLSLAPGAWTQPDPRSRVRALNALTFALAQGELRLDTLELSRAQARVLLSGHLHTHPPALDWQDLELALQAEADRRWLLEWMQESTLWSSSQQAEQTLNELIQQGWLFTPAAQSEDQLRASLNLWRGHLSLSDRRFSLQGVLQ
ncbi:MAG: hypothetical protein AB1717_00970 [Pseudomonadota bacterium]